MKVVVMYIEGCPHRRLAEERVQAAAERFGSAVEVRSQNVDLMTDTERAAFRGSPTLLVDGVDPFEDSGAGPTGSACRLYRTERGIEGAPSLNDLEEVMSRRERTGKFE